MPDDANTPGERRPPALTRGEAVVRLAAIGAVVLAVTGGFAYAGGWLTPARLTPVRLVDTFEQVNGLHSGFHRNHAEGVCVAGFFESNGRGVRLSRAAVFVPGRVPVTGRFALAGGQPYAADAARTVRSLALRFALPDGEEWRTGMNNIPVFAVSTPEGFYEQLAGSGRDAARAARCGALPCRRRFAGIASRSATRSASSARACSVSSSWCASSSCVTSSLPEPVDRAA